MWSLETLCASTGVGLRDFVKASRGISCREVVL